MTPAPSGHAVERTFRQAAGRAVATLVRVFGDISIAEAAVQDAFSVAWEKWTVEGVPPSPGDGSSRPRATAPSRSPR